MSHITCIVHDLCALGVVQEIQVMGSLQSNELPTIGLWIWAIYLRL